MKPYIWNNLIALDQLLNALLGGDPQETISSRCGKRISKGRCYLCGPLCALLRKVDPSHCIKSINPNEGEPV